MRYFVFSILFLIANSGFTQKVLYTDVTVHVGNGTVIENAIVGCDADRFVLIKNALTSSYKAKNWDTIVSLQGQHMYPSFVATNTTLGLTEIDAVRATRDFDDVGEFNPHVRTQIAFYTESRVVNREDKWCFINSSHAAWRQGFGCIIDYASICLELGGCCNNNR